MLDKNQTKVRNGPQTKDEVDKIVECLGKGIPDKEIALLLNRKIETVRKWIKELHLSSISSQEQAPDVKRLLDTLHQKYFWNELRNQFNEEELVYFESSWIALMLQFKEDILSAEEIQIKQLVTIEILVNRSMRERRKHIEQIDEIQKEINQEYKLPEDVRDAAKLANLEQQVAYARNSIGQYTTEYTKLLGEQKTINQNLKATRDQRIKRIEDSKTTFSGLLRALDDEDLRKRMGDEAELMRLAKDKSKKDLSELHKFSDNVLDCPLLTPEVVLQRQEQDIQDLQDSQNQQLEEGEISG